MDVKLFFNFRSPYCYLASKTMFDVLERRHAKVQWRPLGGWDGRASPDRAKVKVPLTRQDVARWCKRMKIPFVPPPITTDPTLAGIGSLAAFEKGALKPYVQAVMHAEWGEGKDIGDRTTLEAITKGIVDPGAFDASADPLQRNWAEAQEIGVIGVPTFIVGDQIFWGNDRIDFLDEYLGEQP